MKKLRYFSLAEFDCPTLSGSGDNMDGEFLEMLDEARHIAGISFVITSGYRTPKHNREIGGVEDSAHVNGHAADISLDDMTDEDMLRTIYALVRVGFQRIGLNPASFIHVDNDPDKPSPAFWDYQSTEHRA